MNVNSSEPPEDQELTEAAGLVIVLLPVDETVDALPSDRPGTRSAPRSRGPTPDREDTAYAMRGRGGASGRDAAVPHGSPQCIVLRPLSPRHR
jgi:hypothetical protein